MVMYVSKLDAARRQLESAVRLFFVNGEPVSIHTLTGAARSLLVDLAAEQGLTGNLDAMVEEAIRPEKRAEVRGMLHEGQNFFKHADRDPESLIEFNPESTEHLIWDACGLYLALTSERVPLFWLYRVWFTLAWPDVLADEELKQRVVAMSRGLDPRNRPQFLDLLPQIEKHMLGG